MRIHAPCPLGPPLRVTVGTRARQLGCALPGPGKRRVVSIRLEGFGAPMASSADRPGHPVPVRRDVSLNNFDGDSVEHLSVPRVDALASLDGGGASWAPRRSSTRRRYRCTASRRSPLPQARHSTGRYLEGSPPFPVAMDAAAGFRGPWPRLGADALDAVRPVRLESVRRMVSRVRSRSSAMPRSSSMGRGSRVL
jgi:hypothetical protein